MEIIQIIVSWQGSQLLQPQNSRLLPGFVQVRYSPGYLQVKIAILQVLVQTTLAPKGRCQRHSKIVAYKTWKKLFQYKIKMLYILTFQIVFMFPAKFLVLSYFFEQNTGYFWTWTDKIQISRFSTFPGSNGNRVSTMILSFWNKMVLKTTVLLLQVVFLWSQVMWISQILIQ